MPIYERNLHRRNQYEQGGMPWTKKRRNSLQWTDRTSRQILYNQRVVWKRSMIYGMGLWTNTRCEVWSLVVVRRMAIELKYCKSPQIHKHIKLTSIHEHLFYKNFISRSGYKRQKCISSNKGASILQIFYTSVYQSGQKSQKCKN